MPEINPTITSVTSGGESPPQQPTIRIRTDVKKCPHCDNNIEYLKYETTGQIEYGESNLDGDDRELSDSNYDNTETTYVCPDCDEETNPSHLIDVPEEIQETQETTPPQSQINITTPPVQNPDQESQEPQPHIENFNRTQFSPEGPNRHIPNRPEIPTFLRCPKCHELTESTLSKERNDQYNHCFNGEDEIEVNCWSCGKKLTKKHVVDTAKLMF